MAAGTVGTAALIAAGIPIAPIIPIVGALVLVLMPFLSDKLKSMREASQNEKIKSQIIGNVIPSVIPQIRDKIDIFISQQTDAFIKAVMEKFEEEGKSIKYALENAKKDKEISENEFKEKLEILKADIEKTKKLILQLDTDEE